MGEAMELAVAATAAGVGGLLATSILYPLDTLKTRLSSEQKEQAESDHDDEETSLVEVVRSYYRGFPFKATEASVSKFLYFYAYTKLSQLAAAAAHRKGRSVGTFTTLAIGYVSELLHLPVTLPLEVVGTKLQAARAGDQNVVQAVRNMIREHGWRGFYRGIETCWVLALQPAIQYTIFERLKVIYLRGGNGMQEALSAVEAFVLGALSRAIATLLLFPYIRAKVLLQARSKQEASQHNASPSSVLATLRHVYMSEGRHGLYAGLTP